MAQDVRNVGAGDGVRVRRRGIGRYVRGRALGIGEGLPPTSTRRSKTLCKDLT